MINKIKNTYLTPEFFKFIIVGSINTLNHNIIYLIILPHLNYLLSNLISFFISMIISFFLNCLFTFKSKPDWHKFILFPLSNIPNLILQTIGIYIIVQIIGIPKEWGAIIATLVALPLTFIAMKFIFIFKNNK